MKKTNAILLKLSDETFSRLREYADDIRANVPRGIDITMTEAARAALERGLGDHDHGDE